MQESTLPLKSRIRYRKRSWLRKLIIFVQRLAVATGIVFVIFIIGTIGAIENNADLFYGTIKIVCYAICVFLSYAAYNILEIALLWEHKRRVEKANKKSA